MKRAALLVAIVLVSLAPPLEAVAYKCVLTNTCKPLPCEFVGELNAARASERAARAPLPIDVNSATSRDVNNTFAQQWRDIMAIYQKYRKCRLHAGMPDLRVSRDCRIVYSDGTLGQEAAPEKSLDDAKRDSSTCTEFVEAEYAAIQEEQVACVAFRGRKTTVGVLQQRQLMTTHARVKSLEAALLQYLKSCKPDATLSRQLADSGLDALARKAQKDRIKWKTASRARK
jgi:hypothetical protein